MLCVWGTSTSVLIACLDCQPRIEETTFSFSSFFKVQKFQQSYYHSFGKIRTFKSRFQFLFLAGSLFKPAVTSFQFVMYCNRHISCLITIWFILIQWTWANDDLSTMTTILETHFQVLLYSKRWLKINFSLFSPRLNV